MLYQLSYTRTKRNSGASDRNRTDDNHVGNVMLYQLSYTRMSCFLLYRKCHYLQATLVRFFEKNNKTGILY